MSVLCHDNYDNGGMNDKDEGEKVLKPTGRWTEAQLWGTCKPPTQDLPPPDTQHTALFFFCFRAARISRSLMADLLGAKDEGVYLRVILVGQPILHTGYRVFYLMHFYVLI